MPDDRQELHAYEFTITFQGSKKTRTGFLEEVPSLANVCWRAEIQRALRGRPPGPVRFEDRDEFLHVMLRLMSDELHAGGTLTQEAISARYGQTPKGEPLLSEQEIRRYCYQFGYRWLDLKQEAYTQHASRPS